MPSKEAEGCITFSNVAFEYPQRREGTEFAAVPFRCMSWVPKVAGKKQEGVVIVANKHSRLTNLLPVRSRLLHALGTEWGS